MTHWATFQDQVSIIAGRHRLSAVNTSAGAGLWDLMGVATAVGPGPRVAALIGDALRARLAAHAEVHDLPDGFAQSWIELVRPTHLIVQSSLARRSPWSTHTTSWGLVSGPLRTAIELLRKEGAQTFVVVDDVDFPYLDFGPVEYLPNIRSRSYVESTEITDALYSELISFAEDTSRIDGPNA